MLCSVRCVLFITNSSVDEDDAIRFMRSLGSTTFLFPMGWQQHYFENPEMPLVFKKGPDAAYHPSTVDDLLVEAGAQVCWYWKLVDDLCRSSLICTRSTT